MFVKYFLNVLLLFLSIFQSFYLTSFFHIFTQNSICFAIKPFFYQNLFPIKEIPCRKSLLHKDLRKHTNYTLNKLLEGFADTAKAASFF